MVRPLAACISATTAILVSSPLALANVTFEPETKADRFDVARGAVVTSNSPVVSSFIEAMLGHPGGSPEPGVTFFADSPDDTIHFIEWSVPSPILLEGFNLWASSDVPTLPFQRAFDHFVLKAKVGDGFVILFEQDLEVPYEFIEQPLVFSTPVEPVVASEFRAEFRQYEDGPGPRIYEIDGFGGESCGDTNSAGGITAADALATLRAAIGSGLCLLCVCDVDSSESLVASDALSILRRAVGSAVMLGCPTCYQGQAP